MEVVLPVGIARQPISDSAVSDICQRALAEAVGRKKPMTNTAAPKHERWMPQPEAERMRDLERGAAAIRYAPEPGPTVPVIVKPIGAASALGAIRSADPSLVEWETKAQDVTGWVAAVEVATEAGAPASVLQLAHAAVS